MGILGLIVSISGFTIAVWQIRRTHTAAESAAQAATEAREAVLRGISIPDLVEAQTIIGELLELHRNQELADIPSKYEHLRGILTDVKANLSEDYSSLFDEAIEVLLDIEDEVEQAIFLDDSSEFDTTTVNSRLREIQQTLHEVRADIERTTSILSDKGD